MGFRFISIPDKDLADDFIPVTFPRLVRLCFDSLPGVVTDGFACQSQRKSAVERGGLFALLFFIILTIHGESTVFQI
jgi:hypothetical protein